MWREVLVLRLGRGGDVCASFYSYLFGTIHVKIPPTMDDVISGGMKAAGGKAEIAAYVAAVAATEVQALADLRENMVLRLNICFPNFKLKRVTTCARCRHSQGIGWVRGRGDTYALFSITDLVKGALDCFVVSFEIFMSCCFGMLNVDETRLINSSLSNITRGDVVLDKRVKDGVLAATCSCCWRNSSSSGRSLSLTKSLYVFLMWFSAYFFISV